MSTLKFKTNIKCTGCIAKVTPFLNEKKGVEKWEVDLQDTDRILTVATDGLSEKEVTDTVESAGFTAELV